MPCSEISCSTHNSMDVDSSVGAERAESSYGEKLEKSDACAVTIQEVNGEDEEVASLVSIEEMPFSEISCSTHNAMDVDSSVGAERAKSSDGEKLEKSDACAVTIQEVNGEDEEVASLVSIEEMPFSEISCSTHNAMDVDSSVGAERAESSYGEKLEKSDACAVTIQEVNGEDEEVASLVSIEEMPFSEISCSTHNAMDVDSSVGAERAESSYGEKLEKSDACAVTIQEVNGEDEEVASLVSIEEMPFSEISCSTHNAMDVDSSVGAERAESSDGEKLEKSDACAVTIQEVNGEDEEVASLVSIEEMPCSEISCSTHNAMDVDSSVGAERAESSDGEKLEKSDACAVTIQEVNGEDEEVASLVSIEEMPFSEISCLTQDDVKKSEKVLFSGVLVSYGFFKLFSDKYQLVDNAEEADILVVPASVNGQTKFPTLKLFQCLLGRRLSIVSNCWVKDSIRHGEIQCLERYKVTSASNYGDFAENENFIPFEFKINGTSWTDITEDTIRNLLNKLGGIEVLTTGPQTVIICADGELHTSIHCVGKEWIFQCIVDGKIRIPSNTDDDTPLVHGSEDEESEIVEFQAFKAKKKITVQLSGLKSGNRSQKRQCCVYCDSLHTKFHRHCTSKHSDEPEVAKILSLPKKSRARRRAWIELASKGNFAHNTKVHARVSGVIIPKYRPAENKEDRKYLPCQFCRAFIVANDLWKHHKTCVSKPESIKSDGPVKNSRMLLPVSNCSEELRSKVIAKMRDDKVSAVVRTDSLILSFGNRKFEKHGKYEHMHQHIGQWMRELARLVIVMKKNDNTVTNLTQCLNPVKWNSVIAAVKKESGFNTENHTWSSPSYALKLGPSLKKSARILRNQADDSGDEGLREKANRFIDRYIDEWNDRVASQAQDSLSEARYNSVKLLPLVEDIVRLSHHIKTEIELAKKVTPLIDGYSRLCKYILADIILFNRKRAGEAQRLKKSDFLKASKDFSIDEEIRKSLTKFEQALCETHFRVETRGKRGRKVAALFTKQMKENIETLLKFQNELGFSSSYLFVPIYKEQPYRGDHVLTAIAKEANLKYPERITSTNLRKQLATTCQLLGLSEADQDILAKFMGHDLLIHRAYYRLPQNVVEIAKVSKVLHWLNSGKVSQLKGKALDDIDVQCDIEEEVNSDGEKSDTDGENDVGKKRKQPSRCVSNLECDSSEDDDEYKDLDWRPPQKKVLTAKRPWSSREKEIVLSAFDQQIRLQTSPGKKECERLRQDHEILQDRTWTMIKHYVRNHITAVNRKMQK